MARPCRRSPRSSPSVAISIGTSLAGSEREPHRRRFGLSRASLYRLFEPAGGIAKYIRKARLSRAFQEITTAELSNRRIGHIAYALGFKNVSAFSQIVSRSLWRHARRSAATGAADRRQARVRRAGSTGRVADALARGALRPEQHDLKIPQLCWIAAMSSGSSTPISFGTTISSRSTTWRTPPRSRNKLRRSQRFAKKSTNSLTGRGGLK